MFQVFSFGRGEYRRSDETIIRRDAVAPDQVYPAMSSVSRLMAARRSGIYSVGTGASLCAAAQLPFIESQLPFIVLLAICVMGLTYVLAGLIYATYVVGAPGFFRHFLRQPQT